MSFTLRSLFVAAATCASFASQSLAQAPLVTMAGWNFGTTAFNRNATSEHPSLAPAPLGLSTSGGVALSGMLDTTSGAVNAYALTTGWATAEDTSLSATRTSLYPASTSRVLWTSFSLSNDSSGDLTALSVSFRSRTTTGASAPTQARAWISWMEGTTVKTRSTPVTTLTDSATAWGTVSLAFTNGSSAFPTGTALGGKSFLVELQCFGATSSTNRLSIDDLTLTTGSLTGVQPLVIKTLAALPGGRVGTAYQTALGASGGVPPYIWDVSAGALPVGLTLRNDGISGTPTTAGTSSFTVRVTDSAQTATTRAMSLSILPADALLTLGNAVWADLNKNGLRDAAEPGLAGLTVKLFAATANPATATALATTLTTSTGSYSFSNLSPGSYLVTLAPIAAYPLSSGTPVALDNGVDNDNNGLQPAGIGTLITSPVITLVAGKEPGSAGTTSQENTVDFGLSAASNAALTINPTTLPSAGVGRFYSVPLSAVGGIAPYTWSISAGALPAGLTLNSTLGLLSGTVTSVGTSSFTVRVVDAGGAAGTRDYKLESVAPALVISPSMLPAGQVGAPYQVTFAASGGAAPFTWALASGSLPPGLTLNATTGTLSGTPSASGTASFAIRATSADGITGMSSFTLSISSSQIVITPAALAAGKIGTAYSQTLTASGGAAPYVWSITAGTLPAGLTLNTTTGVISGTPVATTTAGSALSNAFTVQATDAANQKAFRNYLIALETTTITITPSTLPEGTAGTAITPVTFAAAGGTAPYSWSISSGVLPPGITLSAAGLLSGTPTTAGSWTFSLLVSDANHAAAVRAITLIVKSATPAITINPTTLPAFRPGTAYSVTFSATGGTAPYTWSITGGTLPAGLTLNATTGILSGVPATPTGSATSYAIRIQATSSTAATGQRDYVLVMDSSNTPLTITPSSLPPATVGTAFSQTFTASAGTPPYIWSIATGGLPPGVALNTTTGILAGTPTTAGTFTFAIRATDSAARTGLTSYVMTVGNAVPVITITPATLPTATTGASYAQTLTATGGTAPYTWAITAGTLPAGLTLNSTTGLISGVATAQASTTATFTIQATSASGAKGSATFTLVVNASPALTLGNLVFADLNGNGIKDASEPGIAGVEMRLFPATANPATASPIVTTTTTSTGSYGFQVFAPGAYVVAFMPPAAYPAASSISVTPDNGIDNDNNGLQPGGPGTLVTSPAISLAFGTEPPPSGTGNADNTVDFGLVAALASTITITPVSLPAVVAGTSYNQTFTATGGTAPYMWSISAGSLPPGLVLSSAGVLSGTPTSTAAATFAVRATDSTGATGTRSYTLTSPCPTITISPTTVPDFSVGTPASLTLIASGGSAPYTWSVSSGVLPAGLTLSASGLLSGTPTVAGSYTLAVSAKDAGNCSASRTFLLTIKNPAAVITINPGTLPNATAATPYQQTLTASGGTAPYTWAITSGTLPAGLALSASTGLLYGTPTAAGSTATFTLRATDALGSTGSRSYTLSVLTSTTSYPSSFVLWQQQNNAMGGPLDDPDADGVPNLLEYALGTPPNACTGIAGRFSLVKATATGTTATPSAIQAELLKPSNGQNDLVFILEAIGDLAASPAGWKPVTIIPTSQTTTTGLLKRVWQAIDSSTSTATGLLNAQRGFVRLRVNLDADLNGTPEASTITSTFGWMRSSPAAGSSVSLGVPFVLPAVYSSQILAVSGASLSLGSSAGSMNPLPVSFTELFAGGRQFYAEILTGAAEGRRFEIDEALTISGSSSTATVTTVVLDLASPQNTGTPVSALLTGSRVAIRPHWTLGSAFDPAEFFTPPPASGTAGDLTAFHRLNSLNADGSTYTTYLVTGTASGPKWLNPADTTITDLNGKPIRPDEGHVLRVASASPLTFTLLGQVRESAFARPLLAAPQLIANPWPMPLPAAARALTIASGFQAGPTAATADNIITFEGSTGTNVDVLRPYFLTSTGTSEIWQPVNSTDPALLFPPGSAAFFRPATARPAWVQPRPWTP